MTSNIDEAIVGLAVDIDALKHLDVNARRGNVNAIMASYKKFGQLKPIVAVRDEQGDLIVIAGNHQLEAARNLGWDKIAVSVVDLDAEDAIAFALTDNRTSDLGSTDTEILMSMINSLEDRDEFLFDALDWDDFAVATMQNSVIPRSLDVFDTNSGWTAPEIVMRSLPPDSSPQTQHVSGQSQGSTDFKPATSIESLITQGSTASGTSGVTNALIQYTLVFDNPAQQSAWYSFIKWLKDSSGITGDTTAERLIEFINRTVQK